MASEHMLYAQGGNADLQDSASDVRDKFMDLFKADLVRLWGRKYEEVKAALREYQSKGN